MANRRRGDENIMFDGMATGYQLNDFWEWSSSDLLNNTLRGTFCEFVVAAALDLDLDACRIDWTPWDLTVPLQWRDGAILRDEVHVEVKSSSYAGIKDAIFQCLEVTPSSILHSFCVPFLLILTGPPETHKAAPFYIRIFIWWRSGHGKTDQATF